MSFELTFPNEMMTEEIVAVVESKQAKQADIARFYADGIRTGRADFEKVNSAILARYLPSGLEHIKRMAWKECRKCTP